MTTLEPAGDDELLAERRPGAAGPAFAAFYARHERAVIAYFRRRVASPELAADLTAETFAQALVSRRGYRPQPDGSAVAWLFGIAGHVLSRSVRRGVVEDSGRRRLGVEATGVADRQLAEIDSLGGDAAARASLESLPVDQQEAIWARIVDERDYPEIAAELHCSEAVVRKRVSRGLAALRSQLKGTP
ncbi:MAG TPA: sigma-70 family RNA polymerase sigma factor [Solirubrobacteraceae bacterium]|nr:sigma-70 family RNA polymerase sigma factor [Solirubrobacteraceae bacterium]